MYDWRKMNPAERAAALNERRSRRNPWHAPPKFEYEGPNKFLITAACYEHAHVIGTRPSRMAECESELLDLCSSLAAHLFAWSVLPNHYHILVHTDNIKLLQSGLGKFHGSTSFRWNGEDGERGRKVWHRSLERHIRSERHFFATMNYVHHNPVKHGYVAKWTEWPYSSGAEYLERVGRDAALAIWNEYPVLDFGKDWDVD